MPEQQSADWESSYIRPLIIGIAWIAAAVASFGLAIYAAEAKIAPASAWVIALPLIIALLTSLLFWFLPLPDDAQTNKATPDHRGDYSPEKAKRDESGQLAVLLSLMDEDEIAAFKARLQDRVLDDLASTSDDGELPMDVATLEMLLADDRQALQG